MTDWAVIPLAALSGLTATGWKATRSPRLSPRFHLPNSASASPPVYFPVKLSLLGLRLSASPSRKEARTQPERAGLVRCSALGLG
jgi:hypothetical protein